MARRHRDAAIDASDASSGQEHEQEEAASEPHEALDVLLAQLRAYPRLEQHEFNAVWAQYQAATGVRREMLLMRLVGSNIGLVMRIARRKLTPGRQLVDLVQAGIMGLIKAIDKFKPEKGFRISTYAQWWITNAIIRDRIYSVEHRAVKIPSRELTKRAVIAHVLEAFMDQHDRFPEDDEWLAKIHEEEAQCAQMVRLKDIERLRMDGTQAKLSLDVVVGTQDQGQPATFLDLMSDEKVDIETVIDAKAMLERSQKALTKILALIDTLPPLQATILRDRLGWGMERRRTLQEIGDDFDLSRERIRQIETKQSAWLLQRVGISLKRLRFLASSIDQLAHIVGSTYAPSDSP